MDAPSHAMHIVAIVSLAAGFACAAIVALDIAAGRRQPMWIMDVVWPLTALWSGPLGLIAYFAVGRKVANKSHEEAMRMAKQRPFWQTVGLGATHCGAGCTLGDIIAEWIAFAAVIAVAGSKVAGTWLLDFVLAFVIGIVFQYFTIAPMRQLGFAKGVVAAVKADSASLTSWQLGMYGWMAIALFAIYSEEALPKTGPVFWFMMQIAMCAGFVTSYPVNWWLLRKGLKEKM